MKRVKIIALLLAFIAFSGVFSVRAAKTGDAAAEIPYADHDPSRSPYTSKKMKIYSEAEASSAGIPAGFSGYVMEITGDGTMGFTVDFGERSIPITTVKAVHMRVYYGADQREVRVSIDGGYTWILRYVTSKPGQWDDVVISDETQIKKLANENGCLGVFGFGFRNTDETRDAKAYVDCIYAEIFESDGNPPVISYDGPDHIDTTAGKKLSLPAAAWDEQEKCAFPIEYVWSDGALDSDGNMTEGDHTLILRASDNYNNVSEKRLTVTVNAKDTEPPVILFASDRIETYAGALPVLNFNATDNADTASVTLDWSDGSLDRKGRLTGGTHTLTVTATDATGNSSVLVITVQAREGND